MNKTYGDMVSSVRSMLKLISADDLITDRVILSEVQNVNVTLCTQQLQKRNGWNSPNLFTFIPCIQMEAIPNFECCDAASPCMIARSKIQLPRIVDVNNNLVVQGVWSLDKSTKFKEIGTFDRYTNYLKMYPNGSKNDKFFWFQDNYLYTNDPLIEIVCAAPFFADIINPLDYACSGPQDCPTNPMDLEIKTLPKLEKPILELVRDSIIKQYKPAIEDKTPDDNDTSK